MAVATDVEREKALRYDPTMLWIQPKLDAVNERAVYEPGTPGATPENIGKRIKPSPLIWPEGTPCKPVKRSAVDAREAVKSGAWELADDAVQILDDEAEVDVVQQAVLKRTAAKAAKLAGGTGKGRFGKGKLAAPVEATDDADAGDGGDE